MQHLNEETLARLVDDAPDEAEMRHLEVCQRCLDELEELREGVRRLSMLPELSPPPHQWRALQASLAEEGLIQRRGRAWDFPGARIAAALALFLLGTATGALAVREGPAGAPSVASGKPPGDAVERLRQAETAYLAALSQYSEATGTTEAVDPLNRLAALEGIVLTTRAALEEAPADPLINGYHLSALGQRDAILEKMGQTQEEPWY